MSMVHASTGTNKPASASLRSEPAIIAGIAKAVLGARSKVNWEHFISNYDFIRDAIEDVFPEFHDYNARIRLAGGFHLTPSARERIWSTATGKANFLVYDGINADRECADPDSLSLTTMRSHDQYNTTLYSLSDRYRGVFGQREVVFLNAREMKRRGLKSNDIVDLMTVSADGVERIVRGFKVVEYALPDGCCGAYYPESNPLVPLYSHDARSFTPSSKSVPVRLIVHGESS
jgi:formate dehydrogenase major subunit